MSFSPEASSISLDLSSTRPRPYNFATPPESSNPPSQPNFGHVRPLRSRRCVVHDATGFLRHNLKPDDRIRTREKSFWKPSIACRTRVLFPLPAIRQPGFSFSFLLIDGWMVCCGCGLAASYSSPLFGVDYIHYTFSTPTTHPTPGPTHGTERRIGCRPRYLSQPIER